METWWGGLATGSQVFYGIAITTSVLLLIQLILVVFGFDGEADVDLDDAGGGILSVRTVTAFFTGFGWAGVAALEAGWSMPPTVLIATVVGGGFMSGVFLLMRALYGLGHSGTLDYRNAIGNIGTVYLRIPAAMAAPGQVEVTVQGRLRFVQAFTRAPEELANRSRVRIVDTLDQNTLIVEPLTDEPTQEG